MCCRADVHYRILAHLSPAFLSFTQALLHCGSISQLEIRASGLGNGAASAIAEVVATTGRLRVLDLQRNQIRCQGAIALAAALQVARGVTAVNLRFNEIADAGATALAKALADNQAVAELHLGMRCPRPMTLRSASSPSAYTGCLYRIAFQHLTTPSSNGRLFHCTPQARPLT